MIYIIITSYGEIISIEKCINSFLCQEIKQPFKIIVVDPCPETRWMIEEKFPNNHRVVCIEDKDMGKSHAINMILKKFYSRNQNDFLIFTDGDVYVGNNSVLEILNVFRDPEIGCVCGKPTSLNLRSSLFGYWSHASFDEMNTTRISLSKLKKYFEVSGYLFALRNGIIKAFPVNASEDNIIPSLVWNFGYKIGYAENAKVYVKNPDNIKEWLTQKKRNIKGHLELRDNIQRNIARRNTIFAEAWRGIRFMFSHPKNLKEFIWFICMAFARLYAWILALIETYVISKRYSDGWRSQENLASTRIE